MNRQAKQLKESHELAKQHQRQWLLLPAAACLLLPLPSCTCLVCAAVEARKMRTTLWQHVP